MINLTCPLFLPPNFKSKGVNSIYWIICNVVVKIQASVFLYWITIEPSL